ncbi:MAG: glycolate oxidase subunit GlcE [Burkholderiaceae bacterium]|jgi:glycolate oxidase FAD binding subunit
MTDPVAASPTASVGSAHAEVLHDIRSKILRAAADRMPLRLRGGGSKDFLGQGFAGELLDTRPLAGILSYEPTELVITALAGTPLAQIEAVLAERGQMLAFEPPSFAGAATVGGVVAAGLSGPRRASVGSVRDFVLGLGCMDAQGRELQFGGQVMKNVAGYDVSRLMCGAMGILGLITQVSLKVLPRPAAEASIMFDCEAAEALQLLNTWGGQPLPISGSVHGAGSLVVRFSGARAAVEAALGRMMRDHAARHIPEAAAVQLWADLREHRAAFFADAGRALWRLSLPSTAALGPLPGEQCIEWGGALRWLVSDADPAVIRQAASAAGGSAMLFRGGDRGAGVFHPLPAPLLALHRRLKQQFDAPGIFNPGRMYTDL